MNDFKAEPEELQQAERCAIDRVLKSGWYILGEEVRKFEDAWAQFCGARHAVAVGNGMDAIEIGLRSLDIGPGDEIITTPMTAMATILAIIRAGATPVLADISPQTALLDATSVERKISKKTKAVLLVHLYGQVRAMDEWRTLCDRYQILLLEDCAQAHGAEWNGKAAGTSGAFGAFSFYPTKNLGAKGDGGALITNSEIIATRTRTLRNYGQEKQYRHSELGLNSRLDEIQAAILSVRLPWLKSFNERRKQIAGRYLASIRNSNITLPTVPVEPTNHVYHLFVVRCTNRNRLAEHLKGDQIQTLVHYPMAAHHQNCVKSLPCARETFPFAEQHAEHCVSIPCHPQMGDAHVDRVIAAINEFH